MNWSICWCGSRVCLFVCLSIKNLPISRHGKCIFHDLPWLWALFLIIGIGFLISSHTEMNGTGTGTGTVSESEQYWKFRGNEEVNKSSISIRGTLNLVRKNVNGDDPRPLILFGRADPSEFPCFPTSPSVVEALANAVLSSNFNSYPTSHGLPPARR